MKRTRLLRAKRTSARVSLYASFVVSVVGAGLMLLTLKTLGARADFDLGWQQRHWESLEEVRLFQRYLQIDTSPDTGSELAGARFLASVLDAENIPFEILRMGESEANLIAVLEGERSDALVLHNHIDVEPVRAPDLWNHSPFSGHIDPPWIYGRGAFDMKSVAIAQLVALIDLKRRSSGPPLRSVIFVASSGEERGSDLGTFWLLRERPEIFSEIWGVLTEGGVVEARNPDDIKYWGTETGQKEYLRVVACSRSRQRLEDLRTDILDRGQPLGSLRLTREVDTFLESYAATRDSPHHRRLLADPRRTLLDLRDFQRLPPYLQGLFRNEVHPFPVEESAGGGTYQMRITLALLPGVDRRSVLRELLPPWMTHGVEVVMQPDDAPPIASDPDHPILLAVNRALEAHFGSIPTGPYYQTRSANDARLFRAAGIPAYGFSPFPAFTTDSLGIAGPNEALALPAFVEGVELYVDLVRQLAAADD